MPPPNPPRFPPGSRVRAISTQHAGTVISSEWDPHIARTWYLVQHPTVQFQWLESSLQADNP